jgi:hypothetical protein
MTQKNFSSFSFFNLQNLEVAAIFLTHTHTHTQYIHRKVKFFTRARKVNIILLLAKLFFPRFSGKKRRTKGKKNRNS